jgi:hypothetical protein
MKEFASGTQSNIIIHPTQQRVNGHPHERMRAGDDELDAPRKETSCLAIAE